MEIKEKQEFYSLPKLDKSHPEIRYDRNYIYKRISMKNVEKIMELIPKKVKNVILPEEIYYYWEIGYVYKMTRALGFSKLDDFDFYEKRFSSREILLFFQNLLKTCQEMHQKGIYSGDLYYGNILMNRNLEYRFIDFDRISNPIFLKNYQRMNLTHIPEQANYQLSDKMSLFTTILYLLYSGKLAGIHDLPPFCEIEKLNLPPCIAEKWEEYMKCHQIPSEKDYFLNDFDYLLKIKYELPYRKKKRIS